MVKKKQRKPAKSPWHPKYIPVWIIVGILWLITRLPYKSQMIIGRNLGRAIRKFSKRANYITETNLKLCFPEKSAQERKQLLNKNFESLGMGLIETALGWWGNENKLKNLGTHYGMHYLTDALKQNRGVLLLTIHFNSLHLVGRLVGFYHPFAAMFHAQLNPVLTKVIMPAMQKHYVEIIKREDVRGLIRCLQNNIPVWYMPDTDPGIRNSVFAPFMGVKAATVTAPARFAEMTNALVIPCFFYRRDDGKGYVGEFQPPIENYPTGDAEQDAIRMNQLIDEAIRAHPEQYLWQYKRFKTRPPGEEKIYKKELS